jgi:hypothetical protein
MRPGVSRHPAARKFRCGIGGDCQCRTFERPVHWTSLRSGAFASMAGAARCMTLSNHRQITSNLDGGRRAVNRDDRRRFMSVASRASEAMTG